jgi:hypothetical protein
MFCSYGLSSAKLRYKYFLFKNLQVGEETFDDYDVKVISFMYFRYYFNSRAMNKQLKIS